jgi:hypothetical protein
MSSETSGGIVPQWRPTLKNDLSVGPNLWSGRTLISSVGVAHSDRLVELGLRERLIMEALDGERTLTEACNHVAEATAGAIAVDVCARTINTFLRYGLLEPPYAAQSDSRLGWDSGSDAGDTSPRAADYSLRIAPAEWVRRASRFVAPKTTVVALALAGLAGLVLSIWFGPGLVADLTAVHTTGVWWTLLAVVIGAVWQVLVLVGHELAHALVFAKFSDRSPGFAIVRLNAYFYSPASRMVGFTLIVERWKRLLILAAGPALSAAATLVPLAVWISSTSVELRQTASVALGIAWLFIVLGLLPVPNTDGTRILATIADIGDLPAAAQARWTAKRTGQPTGGLPKSLPWVTRTVVRYYPVFFFVFLGAVLLIAGSIWLRVLA